MRSRHVMKSPAGVLRVSLATVLMTQLGCEEEESRSKTRDEAAEVGNDEARSESSSAADEDRDEESVDALNLTTPTDRDAPTLDEALGTPEAVSYTHLTLPTILRV